MEIKKSICARSGLFESLMWAALRRTGIRTLLVVVLCTSMMGCYRDEDAARTADQNRGKICEDQLLCQSAMRYFAALRSSGKLPGVSSNMPSYGRLQFTGFLRPADNVNIAYPVVLFFHVSDPHNFADGITYAISKSNKNAEWTLARAWKTDTTGKEKETLVENKY